MNEKKTFGFGDAEAPKPPRRSLEEIEALCATLIHTGRALGAKEVEGALAHMPSELRARVQAKLTEMEQPASEPQPPQAVTWRWVARAAWTWLTSWWRGQPTKPEMRPCPKFDACIVEAPLDGEHAGPHEAENGETW